MITEEEAKGITTEFLSENKSAIIPIVKSLTPSSEGSPYGQSTGNGGVLVNPDLTYVNSAGVSNLAPKLKVSSNYLLAYIIAHEVAHQLYKMSANTLGNHTNGWPNLNKDGSEITPLDFDTPILLPGLKNKAEWIPMNMKQSINNWFKSTPIKP